MLSRTPGREQVNDGSADRAKLIVAGFQEDGAYDGNKKYAKN